MLLPAAPSSKATSLNYLPHSELPAQSPHLSTAARNLREGICSRNVLNLTSQEESQTHPNTDRDSHVAVPSGESHPYATSNPSAESSRLAEEEEGSVEAFTRGSAVRMSPISRMLRHAPFPEQSSGQVYLIFPECQRGGWWWVLKIFDALAVRSLTMRLDRTGRSGLRSFAFCVCCAQNITWKKTWNRFKDKNRSRWRTYPLSSPRSTQASFFHGKASSRTRMR